MPLPALPYSQPFRSLPLKMDTNPSCFSWSLTVCANALTQISTPIALARTTCPNRMSILSAARPGAAADLRPLERSRLLPQIRFLFNPEQLSLLERERRRNLPAPTAAGVGHDGLSRRLDLSA